MPMHGARTALLIMLFAGSVAGAEPAVDPVASLTERVTREAEADVRRLDAAIAASPQRVAGYSERGDAHFFLENFRAAVADYDRMVELDSAIDTSHWRRGIALFYAGRYEDAARQFERYHSFDNVDRENGIWRYLSQVRAFGHETARADLLKYEKDDREPFSGVYRLFAGTTTPEDILKSIADAKVPEEVREQRRFYAHLYIGLNEVIEGRAESARRHLRPAVLNRWAPTAGYGPRYMWHVARIQLRLIDAEAAGKGR